MNDLESLVDNHINGNLTDAKKLAQSMEFDDVVTAFREYAGYSINKATLTAEWLLGLSGSRQAACDAE